VDVNLKEEILRNISDEFFVEIDLEKLNEIIEKLREKFGSLRKAAKELNISENKLYHLWRHGKTMPRLKDLKKIIQVLNLDIKELIPWIKGIAYKSYRGIEKIKLPDDEKLFFEFLGDIYSDDPTSVMMQKIIGLYGLRRCTQLR